jgi:ATP-dependent DNA helicase PIF1
MNVEQFVEPPPSYDEAIQGNDATVVTKCDPSNILNREQQEIVKKISQGKNVIITGSAGTGKSFLVKYLCNEFDKQGKIYRIVAPTGVAAVNVGGQTIHRFLGIRPEIKTLNDYLKLCNKRTRVPWNVINIIMIDEISMIHPQLFLLFDSIAKLHKKNNLPFGGIQMIFIGDFYQLCPIKQKTDEIGDPEYIFETDLWKQMAPNVTLLKQVMRQNDQEFINALNDLRMGLFSEQVNNMIQRCVNNKKIPKKHYVRLFALNVQKNYANETKLEKLNTQSQTYNAIDLGDERYLKDCRAEKKITLKIGCPVMLLWNLPQYNLCNGSIGIIENFETTGIPIVKFNTGITIPVVRQEWTIKEKNRHGTHILASRTQVPLVVAWALSVHKSQGLTLDYLEVDCAGIFTTGQLYVALSRASSMEGLIVKNFESDSIMVDEKVVEFYGSLASV